VNLYSGFIQVEKVSLRHRLFNQSEYTPVLQRELIHRPEAAGVLFIMISNNVCPD
jgi:ADP-ribose pyrophosphatase